MIELFVGARNAWMDGCWFKNIEDSRSAFTVQSFKRKFPIEGGAYTLIIVNEEVVVGVLVVSLCSTSKTSHIVYCTLFQWSPFSLA